MPARVSMLSSYQPSKQDRIVAVMGSTGAGKSTFIDVAIKGNGESVNHGMRSDKRSFEASRCYHPIDGNPVVFVDTPGFQPQDGSADDVLHLLVQWLEKRYNGPVDVAAIICLHDISANRMPQDSMKNLQTLTEGLNLKDRPPVVVVTTMWGEVQEATGERRETELKNCFLGDGCRVARFLDSHKSAWTIVGSLAGENGTQARSSNAKGTNRRKTFTQMILSLFRPRFF